MKNMSIGVQYVITCEKDLKLSQVVKARKMKNVQVVNSEFILTGILLQDISDITSYAL